MTRFWRVVGFGCACFALGLGWLVVTGAGPGSDRRHGADCVVAQSRPGRVLGDRCFALDARGLRISVTRGVTLDDLQPFSDVVDLTIFIEDDDVDLAKLRDHPELAHVRVQGPLEQGTVVGAGLDILPLRDLPRLRSVEFAGLGALIFVRLLALKGLLRCVCLPWTPSICRIWKRWTCGISNCLW